MTSDSGDPSSSSPSCRGGGAEKLALPPPLLNARRLASPVAAGGDCERWEGDEAGAGPVSPGLDEEEVSVLVGCGGEGLLSPSAAAVASFGPSAESESGEQGRLVRVGGGVTWTPSGSAGAIAVPSSRDWCGADVGELSGAGVRNDSLCSSRL